MSTNFSQNGNGMGGGDVGALKRHLEKVLPAGLIPGNVGDQGNVTWPFWYQVDFDFGSDPEWTPTTLQTQSFQVTQDSAFLLASIGRSSAAGYTAGDMAPLQVSIRDRQSTRQFSDTPIPFAMFGRRSHPMVLPTPMLIMPNAWVDCTMTSFVSTSLDSTGNGLLQLIFFGYRVPVQEADKVLQSIFGG
jgi:hypothetical protein